MTLSLLDPAEPHDDGRLPVPDGFPAPPQQAAYHGLAGRIIETISPHTEADPVAILAQLPVAFGAAVGRHAWFAVEATRHHPNEFLLLVADSAKARKGTSWDHVRRPTDSADPTLGARILTGLSSGEGVIWAVRDPTDHDPGIADRRLLVVEPEFANVLKPPPGTSPRCRPRYGRPGTAGRWPSARRLRLGPRTRPGDRRRP